MLFRNKIPLGLGPHQETLSPHPPRTNGYLALVRIEPNAFVVLYQFERSEDALALVVLKHIVPHKEMERTVKAQNKHRGQYRPENAFMTE